MKTIPAYAVFSGDIILLFSIRDTKKRTKDDFIRDHGYTGKTWEDMEEMGFRIGKIEIRQVDGRESKNKFK